MKVAGIIAEYNPFHNGHKYQIQKLREQTGAEYIIVAMSGDFVQRGEPAITDKFTRAKMALSEGADLVLELPVIYATASAEIFAQGGVSLLQSTGVVDFLGFGGEASPDQLPLMIKIAQLLREEPPAYRSALQAGLQQGMNFPAARSAALVKFFPDISSPHSSAASQLMATIATSNNILAIEYLKALLELSDLPCDPDRISPSAGIQPVLIQRIGDGYHTVTPNSKYASATAIRQMLFEFAHNFRFMESDTKDDRSDFLNPLHSYMPHKALQILTPNLLTSQLICADDLSSALGFRLLALRAEGYTQFADCSTELSNRIQHHLSEYQNFSQFCQLLKTKELTHSRICRTLLHILLDIRTRDYASAILTTGAVSSFPYLRVLGFRKSARPLLTLIKKEASAPLITKVADASHILSPDGMKRLEKDLFAADLYMQLIRSHTHASTSNEFTHGIIIV